MFLGPLVASLEAGGRLGHRADLDQALGSGLAFAFPAPRLEVVLAGLELGLPLLQGLDLLIQALHHRNGSLHGLMILPARKSLIKD